MAIGPGAQQCQRAPQSRVWVKWLLLVFQSAESKDSVICVSNWKILNILKIFSRVTVCVNLRELGLKVNYIWRYQYLVRCQLKIQECFGVPMKTELNRFLFFYFVFVFLNTCWFFVPKVWKRHVIGFSIWKLCCYPGSAFFCYHWAAQWINESKPTFPTSNRCNRHVNPCQ